MRKSSALLIAASVCLTACGGSGAQQAERAGEDETEALRKAAQMLEDPRQTPPKERAAGLQAKTSEGN